MEDLSFEKKSNVCFLAGVVDGDYLYYSSYNFGGLWKLNINNGNTEMIDIFPENRKHEFAFRIDDEIWFVPAYLEKDIFDIFNMKELSIRSITVKGVVGAGRKFSDYIELDDEIWVMPASAEYIIIINKNSRDINYLFLDDLNLGNSDIDFISSAKVGNYIFLCSIKQGTLLKINIDTKEAKTINLQKEDCIFRNIFDYGKYLYIVPKNINGNGIIKYDSERDEILEEYVIFNNSDMGEMICQACERLGKYVFLSPFNSNKIIKWEIDGSIESININCIDNSSFQKLSYWEAINTKNGFIFGIEIAGAPILVIENQGTMRLIETKGDELRQGLLKILGKLENVYPKSENRNIGDRIYEYLK